MDVPYECCCGFTCGTAGALRRHLRQCARSGAFRSSKPQALAQLLGVTIGLALHVLDSIMTSLRPSSIVAACSYGLIGCAGSATGVLVRAFCGMVRFGARLVPLLKPSNKLLTAEAKIASLSAQVAGLERELILMSTSSSPRAISEMASSSLSLSPAAIALENSDAPTYSAAADWAIETLTEEATEDDLALGEQANDGDWANRRSRSTQWSRLASRRPSMVEAETRINSRRPSAAEPEMQTGSRRPSVAEARTVEPSRCTSPRSQARFLKHPTYGASRDPAALSVEGEPFIWEDSDDLHVQLLLRAASQPALQTMPPAEDKTFAPYQQQASAPTTPLAISLVIRSSAEPASF